MTDGDFDGQDAPINPGAGTVGRAPAAERPATSVEPPSLNRESKASSKFSLGQRLMDLERHPVLLFGTTFSGKTTIILSLLKALKDAKIGVRLGKPILPPDHPYSESAHNYAREIFERKYEDFVHARQVVGTTEVPDPFFIPLDIQRSDELEPVKIAILEGKGEWYEPNPNIVGSLYQPMRDEVLDVLKWHSEAITTIYVAPYMSSSFEPARQANSDIGLSGALDAYMDQRNSGEEDSLLFLLSKWDTFSDPVRATSPFGIVEADEVSDLLAKRYPDSWGNFQAIPRPFGRDGRYFMQYVAGHIREDVNRDPPKHEATTFARYPRTLLNWIYGNATRTRDEDRPNKFKERILFPDVVAPEDVHVSIVERITNFRFR